MTAQRWLLGTVDRVVDLLTPLQSRTRSLFSAQPPVHEFGSGDTRCSCGEPVIVGAKEP